MAYFKHQDHQIYYVDQGSGRTIVFAHGTPTDSSEYRLVIEDLSRTHRCIAIDHLGFGHSDKPQTNHYGIGDHRDRLSALLKHLNIRSFHLVVHDFGGIIALPLLNDSQFDVESVTIMNSWLWPLVETEPQLKKQKWLVSTGVLPFLYRYFNISPKLLIKAGWGQKIELTKERHQYYIGRFPSPSLRSGPIGFLRALFDFNGKYWHQPESIKKLKSMRTQIIWGMSDNLISSKTLAKWVQLLPDAEICQLSKVGHFVAEEGSADVLQAIEKFLHRS